ncbi:hypothetical protein C7G41_12795 [Bradyrhizobium sp. MOS002]|nr:hypothetical protein C7G41_12795 [Bradyrhizobium sp. MOS002]
MRADPQKITFGEMREMGVRDLLIYCRHRCGHHADVPIHCGGSPLWVDFFGERPTSYAAAAITEAILVEDDENRNVFDIFARTKYLADGDSTLNVLAEKAFMAPVRWVFPPFIEWRISKRPTATQIDPFDLAMQVTLWRHPS